MFYQYGWFCCSYVGRLDYQFNMSVELIYWWVVFIVTLFCALSLPGLLKMFWDALKEDFPDFFDKDKW